MIQSQVNEPKERAAGTKNKNSNSPRKTEIKKTNPAEVKIIILIWKEVD